MTKAEKITATLATIAIVISIATPIVSYLWLDPNIQAFKDRARLQVSGSVITDPKEKASLSAEGIKAYIEDHYQLKLMNIGKLPAKEIQIVAQYDRPPAGDVIALDPPSQYDSRNLGNEVFITIKRPLSPQNSLNANFKVFPAVLTVSTESGETSVIETGYGVYVAFQKAIDLTNAREFTALMEVIKESETGKTPKNKN